MNDKNKGRLQELYVLFKNKRENDLKSGECYVRMSYPFVDEILLPILEANLPEEARVLSAEEVATARGIGYLEEWFSEDVHTDGTLIPESQELFPAAWNCGRAIADGDVFNLRNEELYNRRYGLRAWTAMPSEEQRKATPWEE